MASPRRPFVANVADLLRRSGTARDEVVTGFVGDLAVLDSRVPAGAEVRLDVRLESVNEGIVAKGTASAPWRGECRRCLSEVEGMVRSEILEVFEADPTDGETLPLEGVTIDLEPVAREAVLLDLPMAPLCREDCAGLCPTCGADRNEGDCGCAAPAADARWHGLEGLTFDE